MYLESALCHEWRAKNRKNLKSKIHMWSCCWYCAVLAFTANHLITISTPWGERRADIEKYIYHWCLLSLATFLRWLIGTWTSLITDLFACSKVGIVSQISQKRKMRLRDWKSKVTVFRIFVFQPRCENLLDVYPVKCFPQLLCWRFQLPLPPILHGREETRHWGPTTLSVWTVVSVRLASWMKIHLKG